ncbi:MAG TPA: cytochrome c3 family protein, partial [Vicinamibacteria bacterium]|nr:cytochrome c3 family protein [Vicinamibacteria bacterium]
GGGQALGADLPRFGGSVHGQGGVACVDCHTDLAQAVEFPHAEKLAPADCSACHADPQSEHAASVHARTAAQPAGKRGATCADCHGMHDILGAKDAASRTNHFNLPRTCGTCHGDPERIRAGGVPGGEIVARFHDSIHGRALEKSGLNVAPNCSTCHGSHGIRAKGDPQSRVARGSVPATCGGCHERIRQRYEGSAHGLQVRAGNTNAAVCSDCHSAHGISANAPAWRLDVIRECGTCHTESLRTYRDGFHGQATALGFTRVAGCSDCHTAHEVLPASDPRSTVAPTRLMATCGRCHPQANARFVQYDPHADAHDPRRSKAVYVTATFMKVLLVAVFTFFGVHTALWFPREVWERRRRRRQRLAGPGGEGEPRG